MNNSLFQTLYGPHYRQPSRLIFLIPVVLMLIFCIILAVLCFCKTDKVVSAHGYILPRHSYISRLTQRGFMVENRVRVGNSVRKGELLATIRLDDGSLENVLALHDGVVVDSLHNIVDGPLDEGSLIASIVDPTQLALKVKLPAQIRGTVRTRSRVRYKFDTFILPTHSVLEDFDIQLRENASVDYYAYARLLPEHQRISYLGKALPVKLLVADVSLFDYFLAY
jgi:hypothetical protein